MRPETVLLPGDQLKLGVEAGVAGEADQTPERLASLYRRRVYSTVVQLYSTIVQ